MARRSVAAGAVLLLLLAGCTDGTVRAPDLRDPRDVAPAVVSSAPADEVVDLDPCDDGDHPCTLAGVDPDAEAQSGALAAAAAERMGPDDEDVDAAAAWLGQQEDVVSVAVGDGAVRFRVRGGRGTWVFTRPANGASGPLLSAPTTAPPARAAPSGRSGAVVTPALQDADVGDDQGKRALLLSPFTWQWELIGADAGLAPLVAELSATRDYQPANGGRIDVVEDGLGIRGGTTVIESEIGLDAWTSWNAYDYVYVLTHGGFACEAVPGAQSRPAPGAACSTALMTSWPLAAVRDAILGGLSADTPAGDALAQDLADLSGQRGLEVGWIALGEPDTGLTYPQSPGLRFEVRTSKADAFNATEDAQGGGTLVGGPFVVITSDFFAARYPSGLADTVVLLNACSSGHRSDLLTTLSGPNTAVIGWDKPMTLDVATAAASTIMGALLTGGDERLTGGLRVKAALDTVTDEVRSALRTSVAGRSPSALLGIVDDRMGDAATGATIDHRGDGDARVRETAFLVDDVGRELGADVPVEVAGAPDDGEDDELVLTIRVDGLDEDTDPGAVGLAVQVDGTRHEVEERLERDVGGGAWETTTAVPLDRDHQVDDTVDLEVIATLPEGGDTRWRYADVPLSLGCAMSYVYEGTAARHGDGGYVGPLSGEAAYATTEPATPSSGGMQLLNIDRSGQRVPAVQVVYLTDQDPVFAQLVMSAPEGHAGIPLGETGTFTVSGGAFLHGDELNRFEVGGTFEVVVTASEWTTFGDDQPIPTVFAGTFRNVGPLVFDNPFPENGTAAEVTELTGAFSFTATACQPNIL